MTSQEDCGCLVHVGMGVGTVAIIVLSVIFIPVLIAKIRKRYNNRKEYLKQRALERKEYLRQKAIEDAQRAEDAKREAMSNKGYRG